MATPLSARACRTALVLVLAAAALGACNPSGAPKGQVIAKVGSEDVTAQELENEFRLAQIPADKRDEATTKRVLSDLVQRKYLAQKAVAGKLDREPTILLDMLRAREMLLATSFAQREVQAKSTSISRAEIDKHILGHPLTFDRRQVLSVDKISIALTPATQTLLEVTKNMKSLEEVERKLKDMNIAYNRSMGSVSTSDIPEQFFNILKNQKADDVFFMPAGGTGTFFRVKGQETAPINKDDATRIARQQLVVEMMRTEMQKHAASAQAEAKYEGDYARIMSSPPTTGAAGQKK